MNLMDLNPVMFILFLGFLIGIRNKNHLAFPDDVELCQPGDYSDERNIPVFCGLPLSEFLVHV